MTEDNPLAGAYEQRLLVFFENPDYKGFRQVLLTETQFRAMSGACLSKQGQRLIIKTGKTVFGYQTFDGLNSVE